MFILDHGECSSWSEYEDQYEIEFTSGSSRENNMEIGKAIGAILLYETMLIITTNCRVRTFRMFCHSCHDERLSLKRAQIYVWTNFLVVISIFPIGMNLMGLFVEELPFTGNPVFDLLHSLFWVPMVIQLWFTLFKIRPFTRMLSFKERIVDFLNFMYLAMLMYEINLILYSYQFLFEQNWAIGGSLLIVTVVAGVMITRALSKLKVFQWPDSYS